MTAIDTLYAAQEAAKMLLAAMSDLEQSFVDMAKIQVEDIAREVAGEEQTTNRWITSGEVPPDGELVVVKTKTGEIYFGSAYNGRLMPNVTAWCRLPKN